MLGKWKKEKQSADSSVLEDYRALCHNSTYPIENIIVVDFNYLIYLYLSIVNLYI